MANWTFLSLLLVCYLLPFTFAQECSKVKCPDNTVCNEAPKECITSPCLQYECVSEPETENVCASATCIEGQICLPEPKECFTTPCPQFKCLTFEEYVCATSTCLQTQKCVPDVKQCFTTPCPQYNCVDLTDDEETECNTVCTDENAPVCGSNGQTYFNLCQLEVDACLTKSDITVQSQGECENSDNEEGDDDETECDTMCTQEVSPVCGSDGQTYSNECQLKVAACQTKTDITVQSQGECENNDETECDTMCTQDYTPVCGSDSQTYSNECQLKAAACQTKTDITVQSQGECENNDETECNIVCPAMYQPVCGSDSQTYSNECQLKAAACQTKSDITVQSQGECENNDETECNTICTDDYTPVCGSDSQTYSNECQLKVAACQTKTEITVQSQGECENNDEPTCDIVCPAMYQPVCGSDSQTYSNECQLRVAACQTKSDITVQFQGECPQVACDYFCTEEYAPVCGSDDTTYSNECKLHDAACKTKTTITVQSQGQCPGDETECDTMCAQDYAPVCGSDSQTYSNECQLKVAACQTKSDITVQFQGECPQVACDYFCTEEYAPVCGSDDTTYSNECKLHDAACKTKTTITVKSQGECQEVDECPFNCPDDYTPVCGSDDITYGNECILQWMACKTKSAITVGLNAACSEKETCDKPCTLEYSPVCGSDLMTYQNECEFNNVKCSQKSDTQIIHSGACKVNWAVFAIMDKDHDSKVSLQEFLAFSGMSESTFHALDKNGDGFLTPEEFEGVVAFSSQSRDSTKTAIIASVVVVAVVAIAVIATIVIVKRRSQNRFVPLDQEQEFSKEYRSI